MSSKSSSGSLVKSVESILPKGVNLKHVLLAVLVGLLLCMMFGQTVESFAGQFVDPSTGYCKNTGGGASDQSSCNVSDDYKQSAAGAAFQCVSSDTTKLLADGEISYLATTIDECGGITTLADAQASSECSAALLAGGDFWCRLRLYGARCHAADRFRSRRAAVATG